MFLLCALTTKLNYKAIIILLTLLATLSGCDNDNGSNGGGVITQPTIISVTSVNLNKTSTTILVAGTEQLAATVLPENATNQNVSWSTSDASKATVSASGLVTAIAPGNAAITVTTADGNFKATCAITISAVAVAVTGVSLTKSTTTITVGLTEQLAATVLPVNATNQNVSWSTSDASKATVSASGLVTAIAPGSSTITVTTADGNFKATSVVTVIDPFTLVNQPGDTVLVKVGSTSFDMVYANNQSSITIPTDIDDTGTATLDRKYLIGKAEVTNALMREVLQWAYNNGKFSSNVDDHNGLDTSTIKYGGLQLLDLDDISIKMSYAAGSFNIASGYANHPVTNITWFGAIMFCNWLTEMIDGNTDNLVYSGIDTTWEHTETVEDPTKTGFRLPSRTEWEFAARYLGQTVPIDGDLASQYVAQNYNGGNASLTAGYYWTPGEYASGATADYNNAAATALVAVYGLSTCAAVKSKKANQLGVHDMSGNVWEWMFDSYGGSGSSRIMRSGGYSNGAYHMPVGLSDGGSSYEECFNLGLRLAKTKQP